MEENGFQDGCFVRTRGREEWKESSDDNEGEPDTDKDTDKVCDGCVDGPYEEDETNEEENEGDLENDGKESRDLCDLVLAEPGNTKLSDLATLLW